VLTGTAAAGIFPGSFDPPRPSSRHHRELPSWRGMGQVPHARTSCRGTLHRDLVLSGPMACSFAGLCYAELASMIPIAGSAYTYSYATLGEIFAWIIGWDSSSNTWSAMWWSRSASRVHQGATGIICVHLPDRWSTPVWNPDTGLAPTSTSSVPHHLHPDRVAGARRARVR